MAASSDFDDDFASSRREQQNIQPQGEVVRLTWSVDGHGDMVDCNDAFLWVMGYTRGEVEHHPGTRLLRPETSWHDPEIQGIIQQMARLKDGLSREEHIGPTWIQPKTAGCVEIADALMTYRQVDGADIWDVITNVSASYLPGETPWDRLRAERLIAEQTAQRVDELARKVEDLERRRKRRKRSDHGERELYSPPDFETAARASLSKGAVTVGQFLRDLKIKSHNTLPRYLEPYWETPGVPESPGVTISRLGRLWYPDLYF